MRNVVLRVASAAVVLVPLAVSAKVVTLNTTIATTTPKLIVGQVYDIAVDWTSLGHATWKLYETGIVSSILGGGGLKPYTSAQDAGLSFKASSNKPLTFSFVFGGATPTNVKISSATISGNFAPGASVPSPVAGGGIFGLGMLVSALLLARRAKQA
jgi:hypothetical protein